MQSITILNTSVRQDAEGRYSLNDLHKAAGGDKRHQPANFLRADGVQAFIEVLDSEKQGSKFFAPSVCVARDKRGVPGTFASASIALKYAEWLGSDACAEFMQKLGYAPTIVNVRRQEFVFGEEIVERLFSGYTIIRQFAVFGGKYRIDWYIPELRLAVEFDEAHHATPPNLKRDAARQAEIEAALGCRFLRYKAD